jgi:LuxR family maltose regulon positive regulatory protein
LLSGAPRKDVDTLHRRASRWFEHQGLLPEAIHHALAASDFVQAARLIAQAAEPAMRVGAFATLLNWLAALPTEHVRAQPQLCLAYAWMLLGSPSFQVDVIERWVQDALRVLPADHPSAGTLAGEAAVLRAVIASVQEENARAIALSRQALEWLVRDSVWRSVAAMILGVSYQLRGDVAAARVALAEALRLSQAHGFHHIELIVRSHLAELAVLQGELDDAVTVYRQVLDQANALGYPQRGAVLAHGGLGQILYERNQLDAALEHLQAGITLYQQTGGAVRGALALYVLLARVYQVQGNPQRAFAALAEGEQLAHAAGGEALLPLIATWRARLQLAQGDKVAPTRWASDCGLSVADEHAGLPHPVPREVEYTTLIRVYIAQGQSGAAVLLLERLLEAASKAGRTGSVIEILILQALALQALDQTPQALATCERALRLATPAGYIRLFVDEGVPLRLLILDVRLRLEDRATELQAYVEKLLAAFPPAKEDAGFHIQNPQAAIQNLVEPLTERELEILRLVAAGASNREIAEQVIVTVGTVKKHLNNIFSKLEVQSRTQALVRARELGLL